MVIQDCEVSMRGLCLLVLSGTLWTGAVASAEQPVPSAQVPGPMRLTLDEAKGRVLSNSKLLKLARPEIIPLPLAREVARSRHLIRHAADVPVLLSAMQAQPDWLAHRDRD